jgi:predicted CXXCH cytochrome family protein
MLLRTDSVALNRILLFACTVVILSVLVCGAAEGGAPVSVARYVGRTACMGCHAAEAKAWQGSHHDLAMQEASAATVLGDFRNTTFRYGAIVSRFFRKQGRFWVRTDGPDGKLHDYEVRYTFGVDPLQQYLVELPGGRLQVLSIAWDTRPKKEGGQRWFHLYPNETIDFRDELHWTGINQNWNSMCAECHSTDVRKDYDPATRTYKTTWSEIDVSCEACHGPGSHHVAWAKREPGWEAIGAHSMGLEILLDERKGIGWGRDPQSGNPRRSAERRTEKEIQLCARCHSRRSEFSEDYHYGRPLVDTHLPALLAPALYHADGQIDGEVYEYGSFVQSRMYRAGVTCSDCHDPHSLALRAPGNGVCLQCHATETYESPKHHFHRAGSAGASCIACHMPTKTYMIVDSRHDHSLRIPRPDLSARLGTPNACASCHADKSPQWAASKVHDWYGHDPTGYQRFADPLHAARTRAADAAPQLRSLLGDTGQPAIARASAAMEIAEWPSSSSRQELVKALADPDPLLRVGALEALEPLPLAERWELARRLLDDPARVVRVLAAGLLAATPVDAISGNDRAALDRAVDEYVAVQTLNADQPSAHVNLGNIYAARGEAAKAEASYRTALGLDPGWAPAYVNLADLMRQTERDAEGETILRAGLARRPADASLHHSLGLLLVRRKDLPAALASLKRAAELAPDNPRFAYVYAVGLRSAGQNREALAVVEAALQRAPGDRSLADLRAEVAGASSAR